MYFHAQARYGQIMLQLFFESGNKWHKFIIFVNNSIEVPNSLFPLVIFDLWPEKRNPCYFTVNVLHRETRKRNEEKLNIIYVIIFQWRKTCMHFSVNVLDFAWLNAVYAAWNYCFICGFVFILIIRRTWNRICLTEEHN